MCQVVSLASNRGNCDRATCGCTIKVGFSIDVRRRGNFYLNSASTSSPGVVAQTSSFLFMPIIKCSRLLTVLEMILCLELGESNVSCFLCREFYLLLLHLQKLLLYAIHDHAPALIPVIWFYRTEG